MRALRTLLSRLGATFLPGRAEQELAEELDSHLRMQIEDNLRLGMTPAEARRDALLKAGGLEAAKEAYRDRRGLPLLEALIRDLRHTLRLLGRSPAFTAIAVLSLALGIGANTAMFTLLDQLLLRRLPVSSPEQLVMIWTSGPNLGNNQGYRSNSYPMYQDFQQRAQAFSYVFCRSLSPLSLSFDGQTERVYGELVSGNYFQALDVRSALGRVFSPEQDDRTYLGHPAIVLSYRYWATRFGADPSVLGRKILVNNYPMTIVGISAAGFHGLDPAREPQIRIPIQMKPAVVPASDNLGARRQQWVQVFARLKPGYTLQSARVSLQPLLAAILQLEVADPLLRDISRSDRDRFLARQVRMESAAGGYSDIRRDASTALVALMCMAGVVLLVTCFNLANLLVARAAARRKEIAVRLAIGASRRCLLRQLLIESGLLALAGSLAGLCLAFAATRSLLAVLPDNGMQIALSATPDWRILAFTGALTCLTVLLVGFAPGWQALRVDLRTTLGESAGSAAGSLGSVRLRKSLVTAQVAFSFLLLAGAGLFLRTLSNLQQTSTGFRDLGNLVTFQIDPARNGYSLSRLNAFYSGLLSGIRSTPGVEAASYAWVPLLSGREADFDVSVEGQPPGRRDAQTWVNGLSPGYFETMGVPLLDGRDFTSRDVDGGAKVVIVNRKFSRRFFGERSPIGRRISLDTGPRVNLDVEIVGLVEDSLYEGPREGVRRQVFFALPQMRQRVGVAYYVRATGDPERLFATLRRKVHELDSSMPIYGVKTLGRQLDETLTTEHLVASLSAIFGALSIVLAAIGLYGVISLTVARRTREIGLRMALGARPVEVLWMVLKEALVLVAAGLAFGIPCAWLLSRYVSSQLFGVSPDDPQTAAIALTTLGAAAAAAALIPAWRASTLAPTQALRHE